MASGDMRSIVNDVVFGSIARYLSLFSKLICFCQSNVLLRGGTIRTTVCLYDSACLLSACWGCLI